MYIYLQIAKEYLTAEKCKAFIEVGGQVTCDPQQVDSLLEGNGYELITYFVIVYWIMLIKILFWCKKSFRLKKNYQQRFVLFRSLSLVYTFDHVYPGAEAKSPVVILYGQLGTQDMLNFHRVLVTKAQERDIQYVLRHFVQVCAQGLSESVILSILWKRLHMCACTCTLLLIIKIRCWR